MAAPSLAPVATPADEMVAILIADELQLTTEVTFPCVPLEKVPVAVNCCVAPIGTDTLAGATEMEFSARML